MKLFLKYIFIYLFLLMVFVGCKKDKTFPKQPVITFKSLEKNTNSQGIDETADLTISFTDGDGDIGLSSGDTLPPFDPTSIYYYNFYIKFFIKRNGNFDELQLAIPSNQRIPRINNEGVNKSLSGDIIMKLNFFGFTFNNDTLRFESYIYDRALNQSNTITSSEIILKTQ